MASPPKTSRTANDLEYLDVEQAANICSVSDERFARWIDKGLVPVIAHGGKRLVRAHDLIQHLIRHNIPIPERLLQGSSKKILFILMEETIPERVTSEIIWTLYRLREQTPYIFDIVRDDPNIELKIITFNPDVIFLLRKDSTDQAREQAIARMANGTTPVHAFSIDHPIDLDLFLAG
ncbi:helix-turn-helix domain-containing protein [uncultured Desulfobulbus sp.]|uniref:helix-turn-helix domain-containing protein n=1 Tax=uncultured Desulfobulbus sp. TaxID=239745 RepID=UPI002623ED73|nr:helix-turn-helix domain-containing protein [uncultured Desulfobulbus sp.]